MRKRTSFESFNDFRDEVLRHRSGPLTSPVDEIVDDMFHNDSDDDMDSLWEDLD
ncbi:MAG: hypothetical protein JW841_01985 [Deltaproteobacteria bacterium]|nr:hypothetical protein [Deltaproteobacteria bacterium]